MEFVPYVWLALLVVALVAEAATMSLVSIWFVPGLLVAMILAFFGVDIVIQAIVFAVLTVISFFVFFKFIKCKTKNRTAKTNLDAVVGMEALVTEAIDNINARGAVKVYGKEWSARSADGEPVPAGTTVVVERIEGVKLIVKNK
ncbi:MAG: NfeD family protein [Clostridia bacterium]|nr:NfeD family protein [Clostridia bacterium]